MPITRLATLLVWGAAALASQAPSAPKAQAPQAPAQGAVPAPAQAPPAPQTDAERVEKLRKLVDASEKALDADDEDAASGLADQAEVLVADWEESLIQRPDVQILLERLKGVQNQAPGDGTAAQPKQGAEPEPGLKEPGQVTILKGTDLSREAAKVQAADAGVTYDFPIDLNDKVLTWVRLFTTDKRGYTERTLARGAAYFPMIRQVFAEEGIPQDLAYLGFVESGYINKAKSYARAVGMWQFMPSTGRLFGLKINRWMDERRDPVKATRAAARYLRRLYETTGDWYLALVGYNAGPLTAQRAQANLGTANFWDMYRSPYLRNQTKNYVPELCAAVLIARSPDRYGFQAAADEPFVFETVQVNRATALRTIASYAGVSEGVIKDLNPQLLRGSTPPGAYELRVPAGKGLQVQRRLGGLAAAPRGGATSYKLRRGDTPDSVARRFGVDPAALLDANHLAASGFRPGRRVRIPAPEAAPAPAAPAPLNGAPLEALPPIPTAPVSPAQTKAELAPPPAAGAAYRARPGDTLAKIARAQNASLSELMRLNPQAAAHLGVGDLVTLPGSAAAGPAPRPRTYTVQKGETLWSIAEQFGLEAGQLKRLNRLRSTRLRAGQVLKLSPP